MYADMSLFKRHTVPQWIYGTCAQPALQKKAMGRSWSSVPSRGGLKRDMSTVHRRFAGWLEVGRCGGVLERWFKVYRPQLFQRPVPTPFLRDRT